VVFVSIKVPTSSHAPSHYSLGFVSIIIVMKNTINIVVRPMCSEDHKQVCDLDILTQKQYLGVRFDQMSEEEKDDHLVSQKSEFQINVSTGYCFVALNNNKIVGFILGYKSSPFGGDLYIRYIGVNPDFQGKGIGPLLYKKLIEKAKQTDINQVWALINLDNPNSIKLHGKMGFELKDRKEAVLRINNN
jgi:L-amino acid N-acyltransferase YncA